MGMLRISYIKLTSPSNLSFQACPLNACPVSAPGTSSQQVWESFSQCFTPAVREVVEFAKGIPGFQDLCQHDQIMLLKAGTFQVQMTDLNGFVSLIPTSLAEFVPKVCV